MNRLLFPFEQARRWTANFAARKAPAFSLDRPVPYLARIVLFAAVYFLAAKLALLVAIPPGYATAVWPASGIALASVLLQGSRIWPGIWLGASLVNVTVQSSLLAATLIGAGNTLEALAGAALFRAYVGRPGVFQRGEDVVKFVAIAALSATIAATVAAAPLAFVHSLGWPELLWNWWTWWQGDTVGIIIVAPLILGWSVRIRPALTRWKIAEGFVLICLMSGVMYAIFGGGMAPYLPSLPLTFAILPFVIWAAFRFRQRKVATVNALVCAMAVWFTLEGSGPFAQGSLNASLLLLLAFMCTVVTTGLVLSAVIGERGRAVEATQRLLHDLREQTMRDPLTSLHNRRFLQDYLPREILRATRENAPLAVVMIDLDRFKRINDSAGHQAGDRVLVEVAGLLKRHVRGSDIACRYGGEEFAVVLPKTTLESALRRSEEIRSAISDEPDRLRGVTASLGVALCPAHAMDAEALLRAADRALYEAKRAGRNQVRVVAGRAARTARAEPKGPKSGDPE
jgi:diguanylate cyclase (GGDEF)-like protein